MFGVLNTLLLSRLPLFGADILGTNCPTNQFFGLRPWWYYLPYVPGGNQSDQCGLRNFTFLPNHGTPSDVPLVLLAVIDDLLRIAGILAVGFIIYGAFQYTASQGSPDATGKAQSTVINALLGLALAVMSAVFVNFLGEALGGNAKNSGLAGGISPGSLPKTPAGQGEVAAILQVAFGIIGALSLLMITISGLRYVLSGGNAERVSKAKDGIIYSLVGIVIAITAEAIVTFVLKRL